jgi:hypothetical protein
LLQISDGDLADLKQQLISTQGQVELVLLWLVLRSYQFGILLNAWEQTFGQWQQKSAEAHIQEIFKQSELRAFLPSNLKSLKGGIDAISRDLLDNVGLESVPAVDSQAWGKFWDLANVYVAEKCAAYRGEDWGSLETIKSVPGIARLLGKTPKAALNSKEKTPKPLLRYSLGALNTKKGQRQFAAAQPNWSSEEIDKALPALKIMLSGLKTIRPKEVIELLKSLLAD